MGDEGVDYSVGDSLKPSRETWRDDIQFCGLVSNWGLFFGAEVEKGDEGKCGPLKCPVSQGESQCAAAWACAVECQPRLSYGKFAELHVLRGRNVRVFGS